MAPTEIKHTHPQNCTTAVTGKNKTEPTRRDTFTSLECIAVCFLNLFISEGFCFSLFFRLRGVRPGSAAAGCDPGPAGGDMRSCEEGQRHLAALH